MRARDVRFPSGQYVAKKNRTRRILDGKEWERTGKPLISLGGCNFRKGNYLRFCRESVSQCGGQGFDPPSAPPIESTTYSHQLWWLFLCCDAIVTGHLEIKQ